MIRHNQSIPIANDAFDQITDQVVLDTAKAHFGSEGIGKSALSFLGVLGRLQNYPGRRSPYYQMPVEAGIILTRPLIDWGLVTWANLPGPFSEQLGPFTAALRYDGQYSNYPGLGQHHGWSLVTGPPTRQHMAEFLVESNLDQHHLRGSLGRVYDTMSLVSGVIKTPRAPVFDIEQPEEFISREDLRTEMDNARLSGYGRNIIRDAINKNVRAQLRSGQPVPVGETVLGGDITFRGEASFTTTFDAIAVSSLAPLTLNIPDHLSQPARDFLGQFA